MRPNVFIGLAAVTAIAVVGAAVAVSREFRSDDGVRVEQLVFPGLIERANEVAGISIIHNEGEFTLKRTNDQWAVADLNGYPARAEIARKAIIQMAQLRFLEPKTRDPERYARLKVQDVKAPDAVSRIVRLTDAEGAVMAEALFGEDRFFVGGGPNRAGVYFRKVGEAQAWLGLGRLEATAKLRDWVVRDIVDISSDRVQSVTTFAPDGSKIEVGRASPDRLDFRIQNVPEGRKLKRDADGAVFDISRALAVLDLNDVAPASTVPLQSKGASTAEVRTFDGLIAKVALNDHKGEVWASFTVELDEAKLAQPPVSGAGLKKPDEVRAEVEMLQRRIGGWAYEIPANKARALRAQMGELLEPAGS
jgi:hypothetical protein